MGRFCKACAVFLAVQMVPVVVGGPSAGAGERDFKTQGELFGAPIQDERDGPATPDTAPENGTAQRPEDLAPPLPPGCPFRDGPIELIV